MVLASLHLALPFLAASLALGVLADRLLGGPLEALVEAAPRTADAIVTRAILRVVVGLTLTLATILTPLATCALLALHLLARRARATRGAAVHGLADHGAAREGWLGLVPLALGWLIVAARPAVPLYWDEHVWLAKARLGPLALRAAALDPSAPIVPRGYPILGSLAESLLASARPELPALVAGASALVGLSLSLALVLLSPRRRLAWFVALLTMPLVLVHLRSAHLDLVVGLLALALHRALERAREDARALHVAIAIAFLLAGTKDEGIAHVLALTLAHVAASPAPRARARGAALVALSGLASFVSFRALLALHGVADDDHALSFAGLTRLAPIALELARAATDLASFGLAWPITLGLGAFALARRTDEGRASALALLAQASLLSLGLLASTERLTEFTLEGTVAARLLVQLAPMAAWLVVSVMFEREGAARGVASAISAAR